MLVPDRRLMDLLRRQMSLSAGMIPRSCAAASGLSCMKQDLRHGMLFEAVTGTRGGVRARLGRWSATGRETAWRCLAVPSGVLAATPKSEAEYGPGLHTVP